MAFHQAEARLQLCCFESIYSVRGPVGFLLRDKLSFSQPSSGADMIFQAQASPRCHPKLQTETPSTVFVVGLLPLCSLLDGHLVLKVWPHSILIPFLPQSWDPPWWLNSCLSFFC